MSPQESSRERGERIGKELFGATLTNQGRGFYVCLELLALARGSLDKAGSVLPSDVEEPLVIERRSHDFARRLMADPCGLFPSELTWLGSTATRETLAALISGLRVPIPGRRRRPKWLGEHLYPFVGELVHYDAAERRRRSADETLPSDAAYRVSIERYAYRGAGGLAHRILRTDRNRDRLEQNRKGLTVLVRDSNSALGNLFRVLLGRDLARPEEFEEISEFETTIPLDTPWVEWLCFGTRNICERENLPTAKRVEALMHWVPYCIARHQLSIAEHEIESPPVVTPVDVAGSSSAIRRSSRDALSRAHAAIVKALESRAHCEAPDLLAPRKSKTWRDSCRSFFSGTLGAVGALNAMSGQRHFTMSPEFMEAVTLASLRPGEEKSFEDFCHTVLFERYGLVVDRVSAVQCPSLGRIDRSSFDDNARAAAEALRELGLLQDYSDMTRMVRGELS